MKITLTYTAEQKALITKCLLDTVKSASTSKHGKQVAYKIIDILRGISNSKMNTELLNAMAYSIQTHLAEHIPDNICESEAQEQLFNSVSEISRNIFQFNMNPQPSDFDNTEITYQSGNSGVATIIIGLLVILLLRACVPLMLAGVLWYE